MKTFVLTVQEVQVLIEALDTYKHDKVKPALQKCKDVELRVRHSRVIERVDSLSEQFKHYYSKKG